MGIEPHLAHGSLRLTLGNETTGAEVDRTLEVAEACIDRLRSITGPHPKAVATA
jgi:cysteine sulfinate desulfinase/cysteine desulfurase-like protein